MRVKNGKGEREAVDEMLKGCKRKKRDEKGNKLEEEEETKGEKER